MNFVNLTNGIEAICHLPDWQVVRIRSTTIEKKNWEFLFNDLDHNLLFHLSQGIHCIIYDFGTRRPISKTISIAVPLIKQLLEKVWLNQNSQNPLVNKIYQQIMIRSLTTVSQQAKRKLGYYRKLLNTTHIRLTGISQTTYNDGNVDHYRRILKTQTSVLTKSR